MLSFFLQNYQNCDFFLTSSYAVSRPACLTPVSSAAICKAPYTVRRREAGVVTAPLGELRCAVCPGGPGGGPRLGGGGQCDPPRSLGPGDVRGQVGMEVRKDLGRWDPRGPEARPGALWGKGPVSCGPGSRGPAAHARSLMPASGPGDVGALTFKVPLPPCGQKPSLLPSPHDQTAVSRARCAGGVCRPQVHTAVGWIPVGGSLF